MKNSNIKQLFGVWANKDSELVITGKMILLYLNKETDYFSVLTTYEIYENRINLFKKAVAYFSKSSEKASCKYFNKMKENWEESGDKSDFPALTYKNCFSIKETNVSLIISNNEKTFLKLDKINNILTLYSIFSINQNFEQIEKIEMSDFNIGVKATKTNIGKCLSEWHLGSEYWEDDENQNFGAQIRTNKHSYIFNFGELQGNQILYCRAARIRSNNNGSVFSQNIRLMKNNKEFSAKMALNNLEKSKQSILIQDHLFNPKSCVFIDDGKEIYWSLRYFSEDIIILNGCGGEEYKHIRPTSTNDKTEYFSYERY